MTKHKFKNIITESYIYERYVVDRESTIDIANSLGCNKKTILSYMNLFSIKRRSIADALTGKKHSVERNLKMSRIRKRNPPSKGFLGKKLSVEHKRKISKTMKNVIITWGAKISKAKLVF